LARNRVLLQRKRRTPSRPCAGHSGMRAATAIAAGLAAPVRPRRGDGRPPEMPGPADGREPVKKDEVRL
jgi:hypothetical protein